MEHALAGERLGQPEDLVGQRSADEGGIVRERLVADVDELEHG